MQHYKPGIETKNKILQAAKSCFYTCGYQKATVSKIAEIADVPQSLVAYYFKKDQLLQQVHADYIVMILNTIDEQVGGLIENILQRHLLMQQMQYLGIYSDEKNYSIYRYMVEHGLLSPRIFEIVDTYLLDSAKEFGVDIDPDTFRMYIAAQYGAHRELVRVYLKEFDPEKSKPLFYFTGTIALRLAGVSGSIIEKNISKAEVLLARIDMSKIRFLS